MARLRGNVARSFTQRHDRALFCALLCSAVLFVAVQCCSVGGWSDGRLPG
jgi:hypothetical protein